MWRRNGPDRWCRICRTWSEWWCLFCQQIDRPRKRACIWREGTPSPLMRNPLFSLNEFSETRRSVNVQVLFSTRIQRENEEREKWTVVTNYVTFLSATHLYIYGSGNRQPHHANFPSPFASPTFFFSFNFFRGLFLGCF